MSAKKIFSTLLAVAGGVAVLGALGFLAWALIMSGDDNGTGLPEEALNGEEASTEIVTNVYFGDDETREDFSALGEVQRTTDRTDLIAYTMEEMIAGPTEEERSSGLYSELMIDEAEESTCGGDDFTIEADGGAILVWMCKDAHNYGDGHSDSVAVSQISQTMSQFPDVEELFVFDKNRNCYGDTEGENACYERLPAGITP